MKPRIGYLINHNDGWDALDMYADWRFYNEDDVPPHKIRYPSPNVKRIVFWELTNDPV